MSSAAAACTRRWRCEQAALNCRRNLHNSDVRASHRRISHRRISHSNTGHSYVGHSHICHSQAWQRLLHR